MFSFTDISHYFAWNKVIKHTFNLVQRAGSPLLPPNVICIKPSLWETRNLLWNLHAKPLLYVRIGLCPTDIFCGRVIRDFSSDQAWTFLRTFWPFGSKNLQKNSVCLWVCLLVSLSVCDCVCMSISVSIGTGQRVCALRFSADSYTFCMKVYLDCR